MSVRLSVRHALVFGSVSVKTTQLNDFADIRESSLKRVAKRQLGSRKRRFSVLSVAVFLEVLETMPKLLYGHEDLMFV